MGVVLALLCVGLLLVVYEVLFRLVSPRVARGDRELFDRLQYGGLRRLIAVVKAYAGFQVRIERRIGVELPRTFLLVCNHQSLADIPVLAYSLPDRPVRFVAKKELARGIPALSFALRNGSHALIDRHGDFRSAQTELIRLARLAREQGICPAVFPEGTRSRSGRVGAFHSAAVRTILSQAELPVVSVAVGGGLQISHLRNLIRNLKDCVYRVKFLSLYPPAVGRGAVHRILQQSHDEIERQVDQWKQQRT
ncbi:MAG: 1-acyl-sn-glycerol-3-phosphate acyltransferase [Spirochaetales bacterium]|nr:1-acyl-sn-glycerol-3-phosphate acyltransferase [Spirochaetales bacterium]